jgi:hypothetical protein
VPEADRSAKQAAALREGDKDVIAINTEHREYRASKALWAQYRDLYAGGAQFKAQAGQYLIRRNREPGEIYAERLDRAFYENYIGSIVDWYGATLFRREPVISLDGDNVRAREYFNALIGDCDRKGTHLSDFFRAQMINAMICGASYTLVDFPRTAGKAQNRAEEEAMGASRAYLVAYAAEDLINWSRDERGEFDWVVLRTSMVRQESWDNPRLLRETYWYYFDRQRFRTYRQTGPAEMFGGANGTGEIELVDEGLHGFAKQRRVPLFEMRLSEGMWLLNKSAQLQLEHFNKSNALAWALTMGLFAQPVVYSEREWNKVVGESYYIQLGPQDRFGWTEPEGHVYEIAASNLNRLKDEIYRVCYAISQAGPAGGEGRPVSGLSKQRDFAVTQEVLRGYGDAIKDTVRRVLLAVEEAREDGLRIGVSGLDEFDIGDFTSEVEDARRLLDLGIESPALRRQVYKKLAFKYLCDERQDVKDTIAREIDEWIKRVGEQGE